MINYAKRKKKHQNQFLPQKISAQCWNLPRPTSTIYFQTKTYLFTTLNPAKSFQSSRNFNDPEEGMGGYRKVNEKNKKIWNQDRLIMPRRFSSKRCFNPGNTCRWTQHPDWRKTNFVFVKTRGQLTWTSLAARVNNVGGGVWANGLGVRIVCCHSHTNKTRT